MEQTFMTIHNLTADANILFASDSITDILGYQPDEVGGKSCFDYFHPDEVPFARSVHSRGVLLDKAAVLHYCRILSRDGRWVSCECCFTIVHDVLVASTSIYRQGEKSERRAIEAPQIRRIFSCSPRDPRYHMLEHLSPRFKMPPMEREPRAALILNRFTRNLTVMFATNAVSSILGLSPAQIRHKSFYRCIQENCLAEALRCLEGAKANDSIAYLRFWSRDPRDQEDFEDEEQGSDADDYDDDAPEGTTLSAGAGLGAGTAMDIDPDGIAVGDIGGPEAVMSEVNTPMRPFANIDPLAAHEPSSSSASQPRSQLYPGQVTLDGGDATPSSAGRPSRRQRLPSIELEAVVSCTSDGLVVVLRKARPPIPPPHPPLLPFEYGKGLFAAPWASQPIQPCFPPEMLYTFRPPLLPQYMPLRESVKAAGGPPLDQLMRSIRDVAVFAWALVGINGNLGVYAHGLPRDEASPGDGSSLWGRNAGNASSSGLEGHAAARWPPKGSPGAAGTPATPADPSRSPSLYGLEASHGYTQPTRLGLDGYTYNQQRAWAAPSQPARYGAEQPRLYPVAPQPPQTPGSPQHPQEQGLADMPREPWREASVAASYGHGPDIASPTSPAPASPGDAPPSRSFRDMWE